MTLESEVLGVLRSGLADKTILESRQLLVHMGDTLPELVDALPDRKAQLVRQRLQDVIEAHADHEHYSTLRLLARLDDRTSRYGVNREVVIELEGAVIPRRRGRNKPLERRSVEEFERTVLAPLVTEWLASPHGTSLATFDDFTLQYSLGPGDKAGAVSLRSVLTFVTAESTLRFATTSDPQLADRLCILLPGTCLARCWSRGE